MKKNEFIKRRTEIISLMLDHPQEGIYQTSLCFARLDDLYDELTSHAFAPSEAQIIASGMHSKSNYKRVEAMRPKSESRKIFWDKVRGLQGGKK